MNKESNEGVEGVWGDRDKEDTGCEENRFDAGMIGLWREIIVKNRRTIGDGSLNFTTR